MHDAMQTLNHINPTRKTVSNTDKYRTVTACVTGVRASSIFIERPHGPGETSIPRSLIHAADDLKLDSLTIGRNGTRHTFRLMEWKAEALGLAG